jgi:hypothetical protein
MNAIHQDDDYFSFLELIKMELWERLGLDIGCVIPPSFGLLRVGVWDGNPLESMDFDLISNDMFTLTTTVYPQLNASS